MNSSNKQLYIYHWNVTDSPNYKTIIRCYGLNIYNETICLLIHNFMPYLYIELPNHIQWNKHSIDILFHHIYNETYKFPQYEIVSKKKIYYNDPSDISCQNWNQKKHLFLKCYFKSKSAIYYLKKLLKQKPICIPSLYENEIEIKLYESNVNPILQFTTMFQLPTIGWVNVFCSENKIQETVCDKEWCLYLPTKWPLESTSYQKIYTIQRDCIPKFNILSFDIEVYSHDITKLPSPEHPQDKIFQISCVECSNKDDNIQKTLLSLGNPHIDEKENINVITFICEEELLIGFSEFVKQRKIHLLIGYNIFGFDLNYMIKRAERLKIYHEFCSISFYNGVFGEAKKHTFFSPIIRKSIHKVEKEDETYYLEAEGKIFIDLFILITKQYDLSNYKLKNVAHHFIGQTKDPLEAYDIFLCYEEGILKSSHIGDILMGKVGKYCVQDSVLVAKLFSKLEFWTTLTELAIVCKVPIEYLYLKGEQVKVYSQIYHVCNLMGFVIQDEKISNKESYDGATVIEPIPGMYKNVIPFDFASLYPTTMISFNIDYSTCIHPDFMESVPIEKCNIIEWQEHKECSHEHNIFNCKSYRYMFLKEPKGIIPTLLENLLEARKKTRNEMKQLQCNSELNQQRLSILEKRQLAFKLSANSVYGFLGVKDGYLPFKPLAQSTTAKGREMIMMAANYLQNRCNGTLIYGDTDSNMINFPHLDNASVHDIWNYCEQIEKEFEKLLPSPMKLEFEQKIYHYFLIFKKKKYSFIEMNKLGEMTKIKSKGLLTVRRDSCRFIQQLYTTILEYIFKGSSIIEIETIIFNRILSIFVFHTKCIDEFIMTKLVKPISSYKKKILPEDEEKKTKRLKSLHCTEQEFEYRTLPAHLQLIERMKKRGNHVQIGDRIEYVIIKHGYYNKLFDKCEDIHFFKKNSDILEIDYFYYLEQSMEVMDELCKLVFKKPLYKPIVLSFIQKEKLLNEIKQLFSIVQLSN